MGRDTVQQETDGVNIKLKLAADNCQSGEKRVIICFQLDRELFDTGFKPDSVFDRTSEHSPGDAGSVHEIEPGPGTGGKVIGLVRIKSLAKDSSS
jgi:hypothetical protein